MGLCFPKHSLILSLPLLSKLMCFSLVVCVVRLGVEEEEEGRVQAEFGCLGKLQSKVLRLLLQALVLKCLLWKF